MTIPVQIFKEHPVVLQGQKIIKITLGMQNLIMDLSHARMMSVCSFTDGQCSLLKFIFTCAAHLGAPELLVLTHSRQRDFVMLYPVKTVIRRYRHRP